MDETKSIEKVDYYKYETRHDFDQLDFNFLSPKNKYQFIEHIIRDTTSLLYFYVSDHTVGNKLDDLEKLIKDYYNEENDDSLTEENYSFIKNKIFSLVNKCKRYVNECMLDKHICAPLLSHVFSACRDFLDNCKKKLSQNEGETTNE